MKQTRRGKSRGHRSNFTLLHVEFNRIAGKILKREFYETLDQHSTWLLDIFRARTGVAGQLLMNLLKQQSYQSQLKLNFGA